MRHERQRAALLAIGIVAITAAASPAFAYVGPGAGLTLLGALWGLVLAVVMSVGFIILWPFRRLLRRKKACQPSSRTGEEVEHLADGDDSTMLTNPLKDRDSR